MAYVNRNQYNTMRNRAQQSDSRKKTADSEVKQEAAKLDQLRRESSGMSAADLQRMQRRFDDANRALQKELEDLRVELGLQLGRQAVETRRALDEIRRLAEGNKRDLEEVNRQIGALEKRIDREVRRLAQQMEGKRKQALCCCDRYGELVKRVQELFPEKYELLFPDVLQPGFYVLQTGLGYVLDNIEHGDYEAAIGVAQTRIPEATRMLGHLEFFHSAFLRCIGRGALQPLHEGVVILLGINGTRVDRIIHRERQIGKDPIAEDILLRVEIEIRILLYKIRILVELLQASEHGSVLHVVAKDQGMQICEISGCIAVHKNRSAGILGSSKGPCQVFRIVSAVRSRIEKIQGGNVKDSCKVRIDLLQCVIVDRDSGERVRCLFGFCPDLFCRTGILCPGARFSILPAFLPNVQVGINGCIGALPCPLRCQLRQHPISGVHSNDQHGCKEQNQDRAMRRLIVILVFCSVVLISRILLHFHYRFFLGMLCRYRSLLPHRSPPAATSKAKGPCREHCCFPQGPSCLFALRRISLTVVLRQIVFFEVFSSSSIAVYWARLSSGIFSTSIALPAVKCIPSIRFLMHLTLTSSVVLSATLSAALSAIISL